MVWLFLRFAEETLGHIIGTSVVKDKDAAREALHPPLNAELHALNSQRTASEICKKRSFFTIEADQRHVSGILKGLELERANHIATPCAVESKNEVNARNDERKGENRRGRRQAQTKHVWDDVSEGDDRYRPQMEDDDDNDSQALAGGDITPFVARISFSSPDRPHLKFAPMQVCCGMDQCGTWSVSRGSERTSRGNRKPTSWTCTRSLTGGATNPHSDQCRLGSS